MTTGESSPHVPSADPTVMTNERWPPPPFSKYLVHAVTMDLGPVVMRFILSWIALGILGLIVGAGLGIVTRAFVYVSISKWALCGAVLGCIPALVVAFIREIEDVKFHHEAHLMRGLCRFASSAGESEIYVSELDRMKRGGNVYAKIILEQDIPGILLNLWQCADSADEKQRYLAELDHIRRSGSERARNVLEQDVPRILRDYISKVSDRLSGDETWALAIDAADTKRPIEAAGLFAAAAKKNPWKYCSIGHGALRPALPHQQDAWLEGLKQAGFGVLVEALVAPQQSSVPTIIEVFQGEQHLEQLLEETCKRLKIKKS